MAFQSRPWARAASWVGAGFVLVACATDVSSGSPEATGRVSSAVWTNGGFELGAAGAAPQAWTVTTNLNPPAGITVQTPQTLAGLNLAPGGHAITTEIAAVNQPDPDLLLAGTLRVCRFGAQCARVNFHSNNASGNGRNVNILSQTMTVAAGDVDPSDGQIHVRFAVAPVLQNPAHPAAEQPYYFVIAKDITKGTTLYSDFNLSGTAGLAWQKVNAGKPTEIDYTDWQLVDVSGAGGAIAIGDSVSLQFIGGGCSLGGHFGELYVDGVGAVVPGISVEGTGPAQANAGSNITYNLTYTNGSGGAEAGVVIDFTTPPGTTFQSFTAPPGATCTTPAVGTAGTIQCTFTGTVPAGATGGMTVTVNISPTTTGTITAGQYQIASSTEGALLGPPISTLVGCTLDAQCPAGDWCDEATADCTPKLANSKPIPNDPTHANPVLNGKCTAGAGKLVCVSGVCDTGNNECGYANGDGPCTPGNGGVVCQSGACSKNLLCEPAGGCNVDADCSGGDWCDEATNTCTPKLANGKPMPNDPKHTNPTLGGTCSAAGATLVCSSGVCDPNGNVCGIKLGDATCTLTTQCITGVCITSGTNSGKCEVCATDSNCSAPTPACNTTTNTCVQCTATDTTGCTGNKPVCGPTDTCVACNGDNGSGATDACPTAGNPYCAAAGDCTKCTSDAMCTTGTHPGPFCDTGTGACTTACQTDAECGAGNWCNSFSGPGMCEPKLPDGQGVAGQPCTPTLGMRACIAGVCDSNDNLCGYANGDGPCSGGDAGNGAAVCRSGICATTGTNSGLCEACSVDGDCPSGEVCGASNTCVVAGVDAGPADAGVDAAPGVDSGAVDSGSAASDAAASDSSVSADAEPGEDAAADAADGASGADASEDATSSSADASNSGVVEGGGCSSAGARATRGELPVGLLGGISFVVLLATRRRRARRQAS